MVSVSWSEKLLQTLQIVTGYQACVTTEYWCLLFVLIRLTLKYKGIFVSIRLELLVTVSQYPVKFNCAIKV